ncbi:MAG: cupin domain-containing protein [Actinobacteria bacterium]|nr:cupin domain-containing protein [Actinomycetota bacterium]
MVEEARLEESDAGLVAVTDGWFVVNVRDAAWVTSNTFGAACIFEGDEAPFADLGFTLGVLSPGQPSGLYHSEANQEDFLVLAGECLLLVEGEERPLRAWDFVHCPAGTEHIFVGAGDCPCLIFMAGARANWPDKGILYPRSELALRHCAGVETETSSPREAYAPFPKWQPGRPETWKSPARPDRST